uniref:16S rRNA (cytosine(967)-C(5))-methyltransferase n=1 Tax=Candidatus Kentrum sp. LFY TaxID=2126342 RepID=A0A450WPA0_9GAMM|nr:MAG: 16S rRNA (cytosine967-C5)-methyltransferase [Candidatus Kentron sp. LFY]
MASEASPGILSPETPTEIVPRSDENKKQTVTARGIATDVLVSVLGQGRSLSRALSEYTGVLKDPRERALAKELGFGVMRWLLRLDAITTSLMDKPIRKKDFDLRVLLLLGLYQLIYLRLPPHAAVSETVAVANYRNKPWAKGFINGVLRRFQRESEGLLQKLDRDVHVRLAHPPWLVAEIRDAWCQDWENILSANNQQAPMTLRINARRVDRDVYLDRYLARRASIATYAESGIRLHKAMDVEQLPGFSEGVVSVQDEAGQLAAGLLELAPGQRVLDACAAPGGKTAHILERNPGISVTAIEQDPVRFTRMEETLARLGLHDEVKLVRGDAGVPDEWWDRRRFDRILLDVPCSGSGVIRRHPDIKFHRRPEDIVNLADTQALLLAALWPLLAPGGLLLYVTCSVFPLENRWQMQRFLTDHPDARERPIHAAWGRSSLQQGNIQENGNIQGGGESAAYPGRQILPGEQGMDGFYYALLEKCQQT